MSASEAYTAAANAAIKHHLIDTELTKVYRLGMDNVPVLNENGDEVVRFDGLPKVLQNQPLTPQKLKLTVSGRKARFIRTYAQGWSVRQTAKITGICRTSHDYWVKNNEDYQYDWDRVTAMRIQDLEESTYIRAMRGSEAFTKFLLKAAKPDLYGDKTTITNKTDVNITIDDARAQLLSAIASNPQLRADVIAKLSVDHRASIGSNKDTVIDAEVVEVSCSGEKKKGGEAPQGD